MNIKYPDLNYKEHRRCECGKLMIKRTSITLDGSMNWNWWCNCGETVTGGILEGMPETSWAKNEWKRVNMID